MKVRSVIESACKSPSGFRLPAGAKAAWAGLVAPCILALATVLCVGCAGDGGNSDVIDDAGTDAISDTVTDQGTWCDPEPLYAAVDPSIGTGGGGFWGGGNGFMGAAAPFGLVRPGPDTQGDGDTFDPTHHSGYWYHDPYIAGFSQTHMHGTGITAYGNFMISPVFDLDAPLMYESEYRQAFDKATELARPGHYEVTLESGVTAELTATPRVAFHRYHFPDDGREPCLMLNMGHALTMNFIIESALDLDATTGAFSGHLKQLGGFSFEIGGLTVWINGRLVQPPSRVMSWDDNFGFRDGNAGCVGAMSCVVAACWPAGTPEVEVRVAVSFLAAEGAAANLDAEGQETFDQTTKNTAATWKGLLNRFCPEGGTPEELETFASALYRVFLMPTLVTDADGSYPAMDKTAKKVDWGTYYSDFSLWDTYRTEHPLLALVYPEHQRDFVMSMIQMARDGGYLPLWPFVNGETNIMVGAPAEIVVADSWLKGVDFPHEEGFDLALRTALGPADEDSQFFGREGIEEYLENGWVAADLQGGSVSKTLEYAVADNALCLMARGLARTDAEGTLCANSQTYRNLWHPDHKFFLGRAADGTFPRAATFDPAAIAGDVLAESNGDYTEGNPWHYLWFVPHDPAGLIELNGGDETFVSRLSAFFADSAAEEDGIPDDIESKGVSRLYYWHGNEPGLHTAYLFSSAGRQDLACLTVRDLMTTNYGPEPDDLPGNDDCGALSAWYVFSAMGLYPNAGTNDYWLGCPVFDRMRVRLPGGILEIVDGTGDMAATGARLDGEPVGGGTITWESLKDGGVLSFGTD